MKSTTAMRVQKHRENLRSKGLKPMQIWVPNTNNHSFVQACRKQALIANASNDGMLDFIENAADLRGWE